MATKRKGGGSGRPGPREDPQAVVLSMTWWGWLAPALAVGLGLLLLDLLLLPNRLSAIWPPLMVTVVVAFALRLRVPRTSLRLDRAGLHARWNTIAVDIPWKYVVKIKGRWVWFDPAAVVGKPGETLPSSVKRAVIKQRVPRLNLVAFTWSLTSGPAGEMVRRYRPDLVDGGSDPGRADTRP